MKRRHYEKSAEQLAWEQGQTRCFYCGGTGRWDNETKSNFGGLTTHHIQRRSSAAKARRDFPENLIRVCWSPCHEIVEHWPHARQLALKWEHDCCGHPTLKPFLDTWLTVRIGPHAPDRVIVAEVEHFLRRAA